MIFVPLPSDAFSLSTDVPLPPCAPFPLRPSPPPLSAAMVALSFKTDASPYRPLVSAPRSLSTKFIALFAVISLVYFTHSFVPSEYKPDFPSFRLSSSRVRGTCPPRSYAAGEWVPKPPPTNRTDFNASSDVYEFLGFEGCASSREVYWHLAADKPALWEIGRAHV